MKIRVFCLLIAWSLHAGTSYSKRFLERQRKEIYNALDQIVGQPKNQDISPLAHIIQAYAYMLYIAYLQQPLDSGKYMQQYLYCGTKLPQNIPRLTHSALLYMNTTPHRVILNHDIYIIEISVKDEQTSCLTTYRSGPSWTIGLAGNRDEFASLMQTFYEHLYKPRPTSTIVINTNNNCRYAKISKDLNKGGFLYGKGVIDKSNSKIIPPHAFRYIVNVSYLSLIRPTTKQ